MRYHVRPLLIYNEIILPLNLLEKFIIMFIISEIIEFAIIWV